MFEVNFINSPGIQDPEVNDRLNFYVAKQVIDKDNNKKNKYIAEETSDTKQITNSSRENSKGSNYLILSISIILTLYLTFDYSRMIPSKFSILAKFEILDKIDIYKVANQSLSIISDNKYIKNIKINSDNIAITLEYNDLTTLNKDRNYLIRNNSIPSSNIFVKNEQDDFIMLIKWPIMKNNDNIFFSSNSDFLIKNDTSKDEFIKFLKGKIENRTLFSYDIDIDFISKYNSVIVKNN